MVIMFGIVLRLVLTQLNLKVTRFVNKKLHKKIKTRLTKLRLFSILYYVNNKRGNYEKYF